MNAEEAYQNASCGLVTLDPRGTIEMANAVMGRLAASDARALVGRRFQDLLSIGSRLFLQTHWWPLIEMQGSVAEVHFDLLDPRGGEPIPTLVNALRRPDRRIDLAVFVAADRRKYEQELLLARRKAEELAETIRERERQYRALAESEAREAARRALLADQLIGIVSHDLRNPLNAIVLGTQLLSITDKDAKTLATVQRITNAAARATRLTGELLDFTQARIGGGLRMNPIAIDLHGVVAETVDELRLAWPGRTIVHERIGDGRSLADPDRLAQVVTNLVSNAMAYGTSEVVVTTAVDTSFIEMRVHNHGKPIPPELQRTIFEPMSRGEEQVQRGSRSVGLGLFIVREIAQSHEGQATVESSAETGTTFRVRLPLRSPT